MSDVDSADGNGRRAQLSAVISALCGDPSGALGPSVYETSRLVSLAPWLEGHQRRIDFLVGAQEADGGWSGPGTLGLVPTLGAIEALLSSPERTEAVTSSIEAGIRAADLLLATADRDGMPDTLISFLIVPALVDDINKRLGRDRLALPAGANAEALRALRDGGWRNPVSAFYLEIVGPAAVGSPYVEPSDGVIGCSAAATAAWLGPRPPESTGPYAASAKFLVETQALLRGPVAGLTSMTYFERVWAYLALRTAGADSTVCAALLAGLPGDLTEGGVPAAPGFAVDAESTALLLLARAEERGWMDEPAALWAYDRDTHFLTTVPVGAPSVVTNARVLQAMHRYGSQDSPDRSRYVDAAERVARYLIQAQTAEGYWLDRWHTSPLYATMACVSALHAVGAAEPVRRAVTWLSETQHEDGSWGRWGGSAEETAYALLALHAIPGAAVEAVARGTRYLEAADGPFPAMWVGKDLYAPANLVRAAILAALPHSWKDRR
ncbi:prenyltransferase [Micromonospora wenchangensis]|uniref:prenyltransferase n=1 Tax=Micromonospora wenchangensis TaxID=1185415 RepID=UPI003D72EC02